MKQTFLLGTALALALPFLGTAVVAKTSPNAGHTRHHQVLVHHPKKPWVSTGHRWRHWGASPFATAKNVMSPEKLNIFFADASRTTSPDPMPPEVVEAFKKLIHDKPEGTVTYVTPGVTLPLMESAEGPMYGIPVTELPVSFGVYKTAQVRAWSVEFNGKIWTVGFPLICYNWSVFKVETVSAPPPPPVQQAGCHAIHIGADHGDVIEIRDIAPEDIVADNCGPSLQPQGEARTAANQPREPCDYFNKECGFDGPVADVQALEGNDSRFVVQPGLYISYQVKVSGDQVLWVSNDVLDASKKHRITFCVIHHLGRPDQRDSLAQTVKAGAFVGGNAYLLVEKHYQSIVPIDWHGPVQVMVFQQTKAVDFQ